MTRPQQHHTAVVGRDYFEHKRYVATCSCGWIGHTTETKTEAEHDATDHVVAATHD
jgi:hypothetical protein